MFILLFKTTMFILNVLPPFFSALMHTLLVTVYALSAAWQAGPDYLDDEHPAKAPFYLTRGCGPPMNQDLKSQCMQAQTGFALAVCMT